LLIATLVLAVVFAWGPARELLQLAALGPVELVVVFAAGALLWVVLAFLKRRLPVSVSA
jgi:hypothetical protein